MVNENSKTVEISRLKSPLKYKDSKVYDSKGNQLACFETFSDLKYVVEPNSNILSEEEILEHAPDSREAAKIRLSRGVGDSSDVLLINDSVPSLLGFYYTAAVCLAIPAFYSGIALWMIFILILFILPLIYLYYIFNLKQYVSTSSGKPISTNAVNKTQIFDSIESEEGLQSLKKYADEINGAIYCGTAGPNPAAGAGKMVADLIIKLKGDHHKSKLIAFACEYSLDLLIVLRFYFCHFV